MVVAATGVTLTTTTGASAATCSQSQAPSTNGEGAAYLTANRNLKVGPYGDCYNIESVNSGKLVYLWCYYRNTYGNIWWYVRPQGGNVSGWFSQDDLDLVYYDDNGDGVMTYLSCY